MSRLDCVDTWIGRYEPVLAGPEHAEMIREAVRAAAPQDVAAARTLAALLAGLVGWADDAGLPTDLASVLDPDVIDRYVGHAMPVFEPRYSGRHIDSAHRLLYRLAASRGLVPDGRGPVRQCPDVADSPYSDGEAERLVVWADGHRTDRIRHALLAVLAGGLGAGLATGDLLLMTGRHVTTDAGSGAVRAVVPGGRASRTVPVLDQYAELLAERAASAGDGWILQPAAVPDMDTATRLVQEAGRDPRVPKLTSRRARITWLRGHLEAGTRLDVLLAASGLPMKPLVRYVPYMRPQRQADAVRALVVPRLGHGLPAVPAYRPVP